VHGFIAQGVDAVIAPVVETGWEPVLREAKRAKIPVVLVDRGVRSRTSRSSPRSSRRISSPGENGGGTTKKTGGKAQIIELQGARRGAGDRSQEGLRGGDQPAGDEDHRFHSGDSGSGGKG
jgi:ABC-type sugar transport system substrate-binding protein